MPTYCSAACNCFFVVVFLFFLLYFYIFLTNAYFWPPLGMPE